VFAPVVVPKLYQAPLTLKVFNLLTVAVRASTPTISIQPTVSAPVAVAPMPDRAPAANATLFHCLIFMNPDAGIAAPAAVGAAVNAE
jgi:hypothetical protein